MKTAGRALLPRIRNQGIILFLLVLGPLLTYILTKPAKPLPPPVVALHFINFSVAGTNPVAVLSFTNLGQTEVCLWDSVQLWRLVAETSAGRITNTAPFASVGGEEVSPGAGRVFAVPIPPGTTQWRVTSIYGFQKKPHASSDFYAWVWRSWLVQRTPTPVSDVISWCLDLLPSRPLPSHGEVCTPVMTNLPPSL
jgi:hypothetical protein